MTNAKIVPGKDGDKYVPYKERTGGTSVVYFTRDLSAEGLQKAYTKIQSVLTGKIAVKLHTENSMDRIFYRGLGSRA